MLIAIFKPEAGEKNAASALQGERRRGGGGGVWGTQSGLAALTQGLA